MRSRIYIWLIGCWFAALFALGALWLWIDSSGDSPEPGLADVVSTPQEPSEGQRSLVAERDGLLLARAPRTPPPGSGSFLPRPPRPRWRGMCT